MMKPSKFSIKNDGEDYMHIFSKYGSPLQEYRYAIKTMLKSRNYILDYSEDGEVWNYPIQYYNPEVFELMLAHLTRVWEKLKQYRPGKLTYYNIDIYQGEYEWQRYAEHYPMIDASRNLMRFFHFIVFKHYAPEYSTFERYEEVYLNDEISLDDAMELVQKENMLVARIMHRRSKDLMKNPLPSPEAFVHRTFKRLPDENVTRSYKKKKRKLKASNVENSVYFTGIDFEEVDKFLESHNKS